MITPILFATELLLLQQSLRDSVDFVQIQNAVLVVRDQPVKNQPKDQQETGSVSFPVSEVGYSHVSLTELRKMVAQGQRTEQNPMQSFVVDRTIGGVNKEKIDDSDQEGGIAGVQTPIDIKFIISSSSLIPPTQLVQFQNAVAEVEKYIESQISTLNLTVTLKLLYTPLTAGRLGVTTVRYSIEQFSTFSYAYDREILGENEIRPLPLASTIPVRYSGVSTSATPENRIYVVRPLKLALGIPDTAGASTIFDDGSITMSSAIQWDFDPSNGLKFGQTLLYSFQDHLVREVAQAMGFVAGADFLVRDCTAMDIFRFQQDVIDEAFLVNGDPPITCADFSEEFEGFLVGGSTPNGWALDYNPGLNKALISKGAALSTPVTPQQMLEAVNPATLQSPMTFLQNQLSGTDFGDTNSFDDSDMAASSVPSAQRTFAYPDGAVQTIVTIGTECFVTDFRAKVPETVNTFTGRINGTILTVTFVGTTVIPVPLPPSFIIKSCPVILEGTQITEQLTGTNTPAATTTSQAGLSGERFLTVSSPIGIANGQIVSGTGVPPNTFVDDIVGPDITLTNFLTADANGSYFFRAIGKQGTYTVDPAQDVPPPVIPPNPQGTVTFTFTNLEQIDNEFLGVMPRTVARNSVANKSILNFPYETSGIEFDFEMEMYDGSPIRGAFIKQTELGSLGSRCLMGQSIGKGNTFYSRNYCSYVNPPTPLLPLDPLGSIPDFLTKREWLILDSMGWNIDMATIDLTDEGDANVTLTCPPPQP